MFNRVEQLALRRLIELLPELEKLLAVQQAEPSVFDALTEKYALGRKKPAPTGG